VVFVVTVNEVNGVAEDIPDEILLIKLDYIGLSS